MIKQKIEELQAHYDRAEQAEKKLSEFIDDFTYHQKFDKDFAQIEKTVLTLQKLKTQFKKEAKQLFNENKNQIL